MDDRLKSRRQFLEFLGYSALASSLPISLSAKSPIRKKALTFHPVSLSRNNDTFNLAEGFSTYTVLRWNDSINDKGEFFGYNNDYIAFIPHLFNEGTLWVNHETAHPYLVHGKKGFKKKPKDKVDLERKNVGGSLLRIKKNNGRWSLDKAHSINRRYDATTRIPFAWNHAIRGERSAIGTLANCSGGITPWGTFLTCEENYDSAYGEVDYSSGRRVVHFKRKKKWMVPWHTFYSFPPEHYGWVVEIHPRNRSAKKLIGLGRFSHEGALVVEGPDSRVVVYSGDDANDQFIYKYISQKAGTLRDGTLYVADTKRGRWLSLNFKKQPLLRKHFTSQTDVLIQTRKAAKLLGATPQDRPEGMAQDPKTGAIIVALTQNKPKGNLYGSLLKIEEKDNNPYSLEFKSSTLLNGNPEVGSACPDNVIYDRKGNLWFTTDIASHDLGNKHFKKVHCNGLFYVPMSGENAGQPLCVATAPIDAELTGPCVIDNETLLISVQHPGERSRPGKLTSHWPDGGKSFPKPCVMAITGSVMKNLLS